MSNDEILFVCTGNQCRSPMAEALLRFHLDQFGLQISVASAGLTTAGLPPPPEVVGVMTDVGLDVRQHRSRRLDADMLASSSLTVAMTRQHVFEIAICAPAEWGRCFTFAELLRRSATIGGRATGESVGGWARRLGTDRRRSDVLALPTSDDVPDPMGRTRDHYLKVRDQLSYMAARLAVLLDSA